MKYLVAVVMLCVLTAACGGGSSDSGAGKPCSASDYAKLRSEAMPKIQVFLDALNTAAASSRLDMGNRVTELQAARREVDAQKWPACGNAAHDAVISAMNQTIDGLLSFMQGDDDTTVASKMNAANNAWTTATDAMHAAAGK